MSAVDAAMLALALSSCAVIGGVLALIAFYIALNQERSDAARRQSFTARLRAFERGALREHNRGPSCGRKKHMRL